MEKLNRILARIFYALLFIVVLPALLILWTRSVGHLFLFPVPGNSVSGYILAGSGLIFLVSGMLQIVVQGKGLPMSAFPPERLVTTGLYRLTRHPIYLGAILVCAGLSILFHSSAGLWFITPLLVLMIAVWTTGFENEKTGSMAGYHVYRPFLSLPPDDAASPPTAGRLAAGIMAFIPWLLVYEAFIYAGIPGGAIVTNLPFEKKIPVIEFTELIYVFTYLFVILIPFVIKTSSRLRQFVEDVWFATIITGLFYFCFPMIVQQREFIPKTIIGELIMIERSLDGPTCALPSFHVIWAFMAARYYTLAFRKLKAAWFLLALLISLSCITAGHHSIPDVIAGFLFYLIVRNRSWIWNFIRRQSEKLANSWKEWRLGSLRIINHGFYGGAAGFAGTFIAGCFLGPQLASAGFFIMIFVIIGAGLWAQLIEGSPRLLRPYGYYGGVAGVLAGCAVIALAYRISYFIPLAAFAMAGPWIQATGRLRCLVQGCCHGKPCNESLGIRFTHPLSRVNRISGLKGAYVHPTQIYSIGCNIISGLILIRLYTMGMAAVFITGIYLIMNGLGRFVEEAMRGEAQTPYFAGMRIYQWIAIINIVFGAVLTSIPDTRTLQFQFNLTSLFLAIPMGMVVMFASGCDFPDSDRRFARLTSN
jgi:protein-S-isoprenylcysteine O-methyltransferase Ste14